MKKWLGWGGTGLGLVMTVIGLASFQEDVRTWAGWLDSYWPEILTALGIVISVLSGYLLYRSGKRKMTEALVALAKHHDERNRNYNELLAEKTRLEQEVKAQTEARARPYTALTEVEPIDDVDVVTQLSRMSTLVHLQGRGQDLSDQLLKVVNQPAVFPGMASPELQDIARQVMRWNGEVVSALANSNLSLTEKVSMKRLHALETQFPKAESIAQVLDDNLALLAKVQKGMKNRARGFA